MVMIIIYLLTAIGLSPGGSGYFTCIKNMMMMMMIIIIIIIILKI